MKNYSNKATKGGLSIKTAIKAGGFFGVNHNVRGLKVRAAVKAGGLTPQHNRRVRRAA